LKNDLFDPDTFFDKVIGVSIGYDDKPCDILLRVYAVSVKHVESKPIHKNQQVIGRENDGSLIIKLSLIINYELKSTLMAFGEGIEVIEPKSLRDDIANSIKQLYLVYNEFEDE